MRNSTWLNVVSVDPVAHFFLQMTNQHLRHSFLPTYIGPYMQLPSSRLGIFAQTLVDDAIKLHQAIVLPQIILRESNPKESRKETKWHIVTLRRKEMNNTCNVIKQNESLVAKSDSQIYVFKVFNFLCIFLFLAAMNCLYFWNDKSIFWWILLQNEAVIVLIRSHNKHKIEVNR